MEDFYNNNTSQMESNDPTYYIYIEYIMCVLTCVIISIGLPLTLVAIYFLYSQVKNDNVAPIYIINLLISDLIQFCYMIIEVAEPMIWIYDIFFQMYIFGLGASVCFMVCIALERYLVIAWPLWYRNKRTIKISLVVCVVVWTLPLVVVIPRYFRIALVVYISISIFLLVPFPLLIFFLVGTLKALSAATSVPSDEKRRIVGMSVLVLLIYTLLFLPIMLLILPLDFSSISAILMLLRFSPLADLILYFFIRSSAFISRKDNNMYTVCSMQAVKEGEKKRRKQIEEKCMQLKREETTVTVLYRHYFQ